MRLFVSGSFLLTGLVDLSAAWTLCQPQSITRQHQQRNGFRSCAPNARGRALAVAEPNDIHEFDFLLHENDVTSESLQAVTASTAKASRRVVKLGGDEREVVFTSSTAAAPTEEMQSVAGEEGAYDDPYADVDYTQQMGKIQAVQEPTTTSLEDRFKKMDFQDIVATLIIPGIISFVGLRWGFNKVAGRVSENTDYLLDSFASEMIYHDGNEEEMRMCYSEYSKKLLWLGPRKTDAMLKRYLAGYAKKKTVSPQSIR